MDTTIVEYITRIDTFTLAADTIHTTAWIECDSLTLKPKPVVLHSIGHRSALRIDIDSSGLLKADSRCDSLVRLLEVREQLISRLRTESTHTVEPVYVTRWYDMMCRWYTVVTLGILALYLFLRIGLKFPI
jgi:hypothetical protein